MRDVIESKTVFETKDGKIVETSAFPFWSLAFKVKHELSDKTWQYAAGWSQEYPLKFVQTQLEKGRVCKRKGISGVCGKAYQRDFLRYVFHWAGSEWIKGYFKMEVIP